MYEIIYIKFITVTSIVVKYHKSSSMYWNDENQLSGYSPLRKHANRIKTKLPTETLPFPWCNETDVSSLHLTL